MTAGRHNVAYSRPVIADIDMKISGLRTFFAKAPQLFRSVQ